MRSRRHPQQLPTHPTPRTVAGRALPLAAVLLLLSPAALQAADPAGGSVDTASTAVYWDGAIFAAGANTGGSTAGCFGPDGRPLAQPVTTGPTACDAFTLEVVIDPSFWSDTTGGVAVRIEPGPADDFDLFVYRRNSDGTIGAEVDSSANGLGDSELVFLDAASGGYYVVVTAWAVAAGTYSGSAEVTIGSDSVQRFGKSLGSYLHDVSEPDPAITIENSIVEQYRVPAPDGTLLDTWIVRPNVSGPVPVVLKVTPYYGGGSPVLLDGIHYLGRIGEELIPRGYAYGIVSVRGTGNSEGCFSIGGPSEAIDTAAAVEHFAAQEWSNGKVGLVGVSYDGTTPQDVWVEAPPSLATIVPIAGISDLYKYNFANGVPIVVQGFGFNTYYWTLVGLGPVGLSGGEQIRDPVSVPGAVIGEVCAEQVWVQEGGVSSTIDGNKDGYWQLRDFAAELAAEPDKQRASVFYVHGLADWNVKPHNMEDWLTPVQRTGVPFKAWLGQWGHAYPSRGDWWTALVAWLDQFLKDRETGILRAPAVQVQDDQGRWRHEKDWPPRKVKWLTLSPRPDGTLGEGNEWGFAHYYDYQGRLATDAEQELYGPDRVEFVSEPLAEDLVLAGMPRFEGTVSASGNRASLMLSLVERTADGDRSLDWAAQSLNHVDDLADGEVSVSGQNQHVVVDFFPQDDVVHAGSRLVVIAAGNLVYNGGSGPDLQPTADGSTITLHLDDAVLHLPVDHKLTFERQE